ncbi:hypothetical protein CHS0354_025620 [Potamilus streckersoni]|uniref:Uncharacterized protein n=1 Tax=Potamilus streckersoni TaxID=2493646 RepID=A0AAE0VNL5_9BIVA|nr:hypothetical protein CHS0354_025620 [Potamilus streckersoni]
MSVMTNTSSYHRGGVIELPTLVQIASMRLSPLGGFNSSFSAFYNDMYPQNKLITILRSVGFDEQHTLDKSVGIYNNDMLTVDVLLALFFTSALFGQEWRYGSRRPLTKIDMQ